MIKVTDKEIWMDAYLKANLDSMILDAKNDFDFVIIITGDGKVRVGKSCLGQEIAYYIAWKLKRPFDIDNCTNIIFSGDELIKTATYSKPSVFVYDEARAELDAKKTLSKVSKVLQDFFAECGMLNHFLILILPDFFELNKRIAISRSECLINVFLRKEEEEYEGNKILRRKRGRFFFYGEKKKKLLYILGKKNNDDYDIVKSDFWGSFENQWIINKEAYDAKKLTFLRRARNEEARNKYKDQRDALIRILYKEYGCTQQKIANYLDLEGEKLGQRQISTLIMPNS
jgi:hypothetical protein